MQRVIGQIKVLLFLILAILLIVSCTEKKSVPEFEIYDPIFVDHFSNEDDIDSIHVSSLTAYYNEDVYYYTVTYTSDGDDFVYELLYIFKYQEQEAFFSIKYEEECYTYVPTYYENYLKAKEEGISKTYSSNEIAEMINSFYGRTIV